MTREVFNSFSLNGYFICDFFFSLAISDLSLSNAEALLSISFVVKVTRDVTVIVKQTS